jgi:hypothetical protein
VEGTSRFEALNTARDAVWLRGPNGECGRDSAVRKSIDSFIPLTPWSGESEGAREERVITRGRCGRVRSENDSDCRCYTWAHRTPLVSQSCLVPHRHRHPQTAQTPRIEEAKPDPLEVSQSNSGFVDKNFLAPLIIAMNVALPLLTVLFLIRMLARKPEKMLAC